MDGVELTRALRQTKGGRSIYILILTALEAEDKLIEAFEAGVDDFMSKPLKSRVLGARLRAGQRVVTLQNEIERDREEIRRFAAELAAATVVMLASILGLPVSSTHILIGAVLGIGIVNSQTNWGLMKPIAMAWVITIPAAGLMSAGIFLVLNSVL